MAKRKRQSDGVEISDGELIWALKKKLFGLPTNSLRFIIEDQDPRDMDPTSISIPRFFFAERVDGELIPVSSGGLWVSNFAEESEIHTEMIADTAMKKVYIFYKVVEGKDVEFVPTTYHLEIIRMKGDKKTEDEESWSPRKPEALASLNAYLTSSSPPSNNLALFKAYKSQPDEKSEEEANHDRLLYKAWSRILNFMLSSTTATSPQAGSVVNMVDIVKPVFSDLGKIFTQLGINRGTSVSGVDEAARREIEARMMNKVDHIERGLRD